MEIPVYFDARIDRPKIGKVISYNEETHEVVFTIDDEYADDIKAMIFNELPLSMTMRSEEWVKDKTGC